MSSQRIAGFDTFLYKQLGCDWIVNGVKWAVVSLLSSGYDRFHFDSL